MQPVDFPLLGPRIAHQRQHDVHRVENHPLRLDLPRLGSQRGQHSPQVESARLDNFERGLRIEKEEFLPL